ncbi:MAG: glycosyltransferase family 39 protein [Vicingaceae bacterium]
MLNQIKRIKKDVWVIILLVTVSTYTIFNLKHWNKEEGIIAWDVVSYYGYLPATFIYDDVSLENPNEKFEEFKHVFWMEKAKNGGKVFKTTMGMSVLYAPFFFASHLYALNSENEPGGYSKPYKFGVAMSSLFYLLLGFIFLRKALRKYFSSEVVALILLFIGLGTNLYYYTVIAVGMPHIYLFSLLSMSIYCVILWYEKPSLKLSILLGLLFGLMVLIRPIMIIVISFPLLYNIISLKERLLFFKKQIVPLLIIVICAFLIWVPQFIYWKIVAGDFLFYSYSEEGFFFTDPQILNALFSFRKGWLLYTPLMAFALVGFGLMIRKKYKNILPFVVPVLVYFYVASCWWDWWFGGSYGYRTMIDVMPFLAFGLAFFIEQTLGLVKVYKTIILTVMFCLLGLSLFQTRQAHEGLIHHDSMTKEAYFKVLFKLQKQVSRDELKPYLKAPNYEAAKKGERD